MSLIDLNIESQNRVGKFNANTKLSGENLNSTVFGMATTFCQVVQAFSQARASVRINPLDTTLLGFELEGVEYSGTTLKIGKINPGILFYKNIPYIIPEINNLSFTLSTEQGKSYGLCVFLPEMEFENAEKSVLDDSGEEIKINTPKNAVFPYKIIWDEVTVQGTISPKIVSTDGKVYIFTVTRNTSSGSLGWQIDHSCYSPKFVMDTTNTFNGRERSDGTIQELLDTIPDDRKGYYERFYDVGDLAFFHNQRSTGDVFPFIPMSTPLTVIDKQKYPDFYDYLYSYKLPLRLYIDGWEWDALPYTGKSEKRGTRYDMSLKQIGKYGFDYFTKKYNVDTESAGEKGTFGKCTFRIYLSKNKNTILNTVNNSFLDNKVLLSIINDLPMHPVRFPDLSNLMMDNDPTTPIGSFTQNAGINRTTSEEATRTVENNYFKIKDTIKPQYLKKDLGFNKVKGVVGVIKIDPDPNLVEKDSIGTALNTMTQLLLNTLGLNSNSESRGLFITGYNGDSPAITETETHVIIEIDDFLYSNELLSKLTFLSNPEKTTTPYYLEIYPYRLPQTPYFERVPMNAPAHKQLYAPDPLNLSIIRYLTNNRYYTIENSLKEDYTVSPFDSLGEDENLLRSEPPILKWTRSSFQVNLRGEDAPPTTPIESIFIPSTSIFKNGMRIPFKDTYVSSGNINAIINYYMAGKTCGSPSLLKLIPTKDVDYSQVIESAIFSDAKLLPPFMYNNQAEYGYTGFEMKNPIFERINRSSWWLLDGSYSGDNGSIANKTLRAKIQYNQILKFFVDNELTSLSQLPLAQKNTKQTLFMTGHSQLGGTPKTGDIYGSNNSNNSLNITQTPDINSSKGTIKPDLHGIILNMRHLRINVSNNTPAQYDYLYYMPKIPRFQQSYNGFRIYQRDPATGNLKADSSLFKAIIDKALYQKFGIEFTSNATDGIKYNANPIGRVPKENAYPRFGLYLQRRFGTGSSSAELFNILNGFSPDRKAYEVNSKINNYIMVPFGNIAGISTELLEFTHPNIGMYLRLTNEGYDTNGTMNEAGKRELFLWQSFGILPAWFFTESVNIAAVNVFPGTFAPTYQDTSVDVTMQYPGWVIFGDETINGNICIPPVAYTNALYPNQVTSRNIALVFLTSIFASREAVTNGSQLNTAIKTPALNSVRNFSQNFFKYTEASVDGVHATSTAWGLSDHAGVAMEQFKNTNDLALMPSLVSLYWEDIRGTWLHDYYQEVCLSSLLEKRKIDASVDSPPMLSHITLSNDPPYSMGDYSSLFMLAIDYSPEKVMKPGDRYVVYYPNQNSQGSMSMDEYISTYLQKQLDAQDTANSTITGEKFVRVPYYGRPSNPILDFSNQVIAQPVRDWHFKRKSHSQYFYNFTSWINYFRKCVREYAMALGVNGFDGIFSPKEQNVFGLVSGGGIVKGKNSAVYIDQLDVLANGIPDNVNNAPEPSPQGVVASDISVGNTKGGNEWNNPNLIFPHKKTEKFRREFEAYGANGSKRGKLYPVSKLNGIPYIFVGRITQG